MSKAIFFDRDGVLNRLVYNPLTGQNESPHRPEELQLTENLANLLSQVKDMGYLLFLISNQPSFAKGKTTLENIKEIHSKLDETLKQANLIFSGYYYCYHQASDKCECRKPEPYFVELAIKEFDIDRKSSWLIGDQDTDIQCGQSAGLSTILLDIEESSQKRGKSNPDALTKDLASAIKIIGERNK